MAMLIGVAAFAQNSYTFSTYTSPYTELVNSTPVDLSDDEGDPWDESNFVVPFGFDFQIGGETYNSTFQIEGGAVMAFGDFMDIEFGEFSQFGLLEDLIDGAALNGSDSSFISYEVVGQPGNKIAKIQYKDAAFYYEVSDSEPSAENRINFQLWFYEENGVMEIHFGESNIPDPDLVYFYSGPIVAIAINLNYDTGSFDYGAALSGNPLNPTFYEFYNMNGDEDGSEFHLDSTPLSGRVYRFSSSTTSGLIDAETTKFAIYPTIAESEIWVKDANVANATYRIMDIAGKEIQTGKLQTDTNIDISSIKKGLYIISIDGMSTTVKFIKR